MSPRSIPGSGTTTARAAGRSRLLTAATLAASIASITVTAGCAGGQTDDTAATSSPGHTATPKPTPTPTPTPSAQDRLAAAVPDGSTENFRFTIKNSDGISTGIMEPHDARLLYELSSTDPDLHFTLTFSFLLIGQEKWLKLAFAHTEGVEGLPDFPTEWMHLDPKKLTSDDDEVLSYDDPDFFGSAALFDGITTVAEVATGRYRGKVDLTDVSDTADIEAIDEETVTALGARAKAVPFDAVVDAEGRLTSVVLHLPPTGEEPAQDVSANYSHYGAPSTLKPPAPGEVVEAPLQAYDALKG